MKWWTDLFSGHSYTNTDSSIQRDDGKMFYKTGDSYFDDQGHIIQKVGDSMMNTSTGVHSFWGDPFGDEQ
jgi:hypothetical protein